MNDSQHRFHEGDVITFTDVGRAPVRLLITKVEGEPGGERLTFLVDPEDGDEL